VPLIPLLGAWDTTIGALRVYEESELMELVRNRPGG